MPTRMFTRGPLHGGHRNPQTDVQLHHWFWGVPARRRGRRGCLGPQVDRNGTGLPFGPRGK